MTKVKIQIWGYLKQIEVRTSSVDVSRPEQLHAHLLKLHRQYVISHGMQKQVTSGNYTINVPQ